MTKVRRCENSLCLYWQDGTCKGGSIQVDERGLCSDYQLPNLEQEYVEQRRRELLEIYRYLDGV